MRSHVVFVCGTYLDLSDERGRVLDAIQRLQMQYSSMELFGARPESPLETCLAEVDKSDVMIIIAGNRYGSLVPDHEMSFSEAEYQEAYRLGKPCLVYIRRDLNGQPSPERDSGVEVRCLNAWKDTLRCRHTVWEFPDSNDLACQVVVDLGRWLASHENTQPSMSSANGRRPLALPCTAQFAIVFSQRFGDDERQLLHGLMTDNWGNIITIGDFRGSINFGGSQLTSAGDRDVFVAKFDREGKHIWSRRYGGHREQVGVGAGADASGAIVIACAFTGTLSFGGDPLVSKGRYNVAVAKVDSCGRHVWSRAFGDAQYHVPECIAVMASGNAVVAGRFQGALEFDGTALVSKSNQTDIFMAMFSPCGTLVWAKQIGGLFEQQTRAVAVSAEGVIALTGVFKGHIAIDDNILIQEKLDSYCGFLATFTQNGELLWCKRVGEPHVEQGSVVAFDERNGDLLFSGFIRNALPRADAEKGSLCLFARYDSAGTLRWSKTFGPYVIADSLSIDTDGHILLAGHFQDTVDFGRGALVSAGGYDMFAAVFTADGVALWSEHFGDRRHQFLIKGAYEPDGTIVLGGSFHGTVDFGAGPLVASGYDGSEEGTEDVFLAIFKNDTQVTTILGGRGV